MPFLDNPEALHESQYLEFKEAHHGLPVDLWETYSAFANTEGGEIVLGVAERAERQFEIVGVDDPESLVSDFWTAVRNPQRVNRDVMLFDGVTVERVQEKSVVVIEVPKATRNEKPICVYSKGDKGFVAYIRRGTADLRATENDLRLMGYDSTPVADREALEQFDLDALAQSTISHYRAIFAALKPQSPWVRDSTEDFLYHIGALGRGHDNKLHPTVAGLLAFGHEYEILGYSPSYLLDYREETSGLLRWDDRIVSQSGDWTGNLVDFYFAVIDRFSRYLKVPFTTNGTGMVHGTRNAVTEAANEAVVNALVHAYYGSGATVRVIVRPECIDVTNSGTMLVSRDVAIAGGASELRNPILMRIFGLIGASDRAGSGLFQIWSTWHDAFGCEPIISEDHAATTVRLTLPLPPDGATDRTASGRDNDVLVLLAASPKGLTSQEVAAHLGISTRRAQERLRSLFDEGLATREQDGRGFRYLPTVRD